MFDNVLHQSACDLLQADMKASRLPGSILLSGPVASGKLTSALELVRAFACTAPGEKAAWNCTCQNCQQNKALTSHTMLLLGAGSRVLEIAAAKASFLAQNAQNSRHLEAARFLFLRSVRKLTARFSPLLWEGEDKLSKFAPIVQAIDEDMELLAPGRTVPEPEELQKLLDSIEKNCEKLESGYMYASLPVSQIRNLSAWARRTSSSGKKVVIIENADMMQESARNALLKILEEPPENTEFVLTTANRGAILPTILSRVRTYNFFERTKEHQQEVMKRVFHYQSSFGQSAMPQTIERFMQQYLPVTPDVLYHFASKYFLSISEGHVPDIPSVISACGDFNPKSTFRLFLEGIIEAQKPLAKTPAGSELSSSILKEVMNALNSVFVYNLTVQSALEILARNLMQINYLNGGILNKVLMQGLGENQ